MKILREAESFIQDSSISTKHDWTIHKPAPTPVPAQSQSTHITQILLLLLIVLLSNGKRAAGKRDLSAAK